MIDQSRVRVPEHAHDWPVLSLFVMGAYTNHAEIGEKFIDGPSAVLYRTRTAHRNVVGPDGFEQIEIEFDPTWLRSTAILDMPVERWVGGTAGAEARYLARLCCSDLTEKRLHTAVRQFIERRAGQSTKRSIDWVDLIAQRLRCYPALKVSDLAKEVDRHPSWLGEAYKLETGEGLPEMAARLRVERAARLLRETDQPYASIAADAGFCDQSHMNRTFRRILGRLPSAVREDKAILRRL